MARVSFSVSVENLVPAGMKADAGTFATLGYAVKAVAEAAQQQWVGYALGAPLPSGQTINPRTGTYARSIQLRQTGDFSATVESDLAYAQAVETGSPERDLKDMLNRSAKVRRTKDGRRYLIIPFRFRTEGKGGVGAGVMPASVATWWRGQQASRVMSIGSRVSGTGAYDIATRKPMQVPQRNYKWGARLGLDDLSRLGVQGTAARKVMKGMVQFRKPGGVGGGAHSQFLTFRTMMEGATGKWIAPAVPGKYPARATAQAIQPVAEKAFARAIEEDLARILGQ